MDQRLRELTLTGILMTAIDQLAFIVEPDIGLASDQILGRYAERHGELSHMAGYLCSECWGWGYGVLSPADELRIDKLMQAITGMELTADERRTFVNGVSSPPEYSPSGTPLPAASTDDPQSPLSAETG